MAEEAEMKICCDLWELEQENGMKLSPAKWLIPEQINKKEKNLLNPQLFLVALPNCRRCSATSYSTHHNLSVTNNWNSWMDSIHPVIHVPSNKITPIQSNKIFYVIIFNDFIFVIEYLFNFLSFLFLLLLISESISI